MANRALNAKRLKAAKQRIELGIAEQSKLAYLRNDNLDGQYRELRHLLDNLDPAMIKRCPAGVASGLQRGKRSNYMAGQSYTWQAQRGNAGPCNRQVYGADCYSQSTQCELLVKA